MHARASAAGRSPGQAAWRRRCLRCDQGRAACAGATLRSPCPVQERDEAARLFGADAAAAAANGEKTFEPGEGMVEAEPPAAEPAAEPVVEEPSVRKGPTQEQLTAIKARPGGDCPSRVGTKAGYERRGRRDCACWLSEGRCPRPAHRGCRQDGAPSAAGGCPASQCSFAGLAACCHCRTCQQGAIAPQQLHLPVSSGSSGAAPTQRAAAAPRPAFTPAAQRGAQAAIANAATLEEVARLESALRTGTLPSQAAAAAAAADGAPAGGGGPAAMEEG